MRFPRHSQTTRRFEALLAGALLPLAAIVFSLAAGCASAPPRKQVSAYPEESKTAAVTAAKSLLESGKAGMAAEALGELAAQNPRDTELRRLQAAALVSAGKYAEARAAFDSLLAEAPADVAALSMAADVASFQGDEAGRRAYLDRANLAAPGDPRTLAAWGRFWMDGKEWAKAESAFRKASLADPSSVEAATGLGQALYKLGAFAESEKAYDAAIRLSPDDPFAWADRSKARIQLGKYEEAETDLGEAMKRSPGASWPYIDRARLRLGSNRLPEALADLDEAIARDPGNFLSFLYRASIRAKLGDDALAMADYDRVTTLKPEYWYALESSGICAFRIRRWPEAADRFRRAFAAAPTHIEYAVLAAIALQRGGRVGEGKAYATKVAASLDRTKYNDQWLILRLLQDHSNLTAELENAIENQKDQDRKVALLFYLGEYWLIRGQGTLATKYFALALEKKRDGALEYRLLTAETVP